jgi:hypothetical protein
MTPAPATPETAALTCPRHRNTYLPGTIHNRLQITADLYGSGCVALGRSWRTDLDDMRSRVLRGCLRPRPHRSARKMVGADEGRVR